jgi:glycosyltransferase involved in cell wall biosynthesis
MYKFRFPMTNIAILTNITPPYREGFYNRLLSNENLSIKIYCQERIHGFNYKTIHNKYPKNVILVKFIAAKYEKIVWQFIPFIKIMKEADIIFIDGNPRIVSQALFATFLRLIGRKVVVWSMVHSFRNNKSTESIRHFWLRLFKFHFLYNDADVKALEKMGFTDRIMIAMNNGLDQKKIDKIIEEWQGNKLKEWQVKNNLNNRTIIVSSGRLVPLKYDLMVEAMPLLIAQYPNILWCVIGDGSDRSKMAQIVLENNLSEHILFVGELFDEEKLAPWFLSAQLFVHPCAVGLSIMHAFGYGLPIITHNNHAEHGPEYIAFEDGLTGYNYEDGNAKSLASSITKLLPDEKKRLNMKTYCQKIVREKYNVDIMADRFIQMVREVANK